MTDVHANLPALDAALAAIRAEGCNATVHTGDAIGIGPFLAECLDRLLHTRDLRLVLGNHDQWFAVGLPNPRSAWMTEGEEAHHRWVHAQIDPAMRSVVAGWPHVIRDEIDGLAVAFAHYGLDETERCCAGVVRNPSVTELDRLFAGFGSPNIVFFGHDHDPSDTRGRARYVNPGSLGCGRTLVARFAVLTVEADGSHDITMRAVAYDDTELFRQFEERDVPEREFIRATFFGRAAGGLRRGRAGSERPTLST